MYIVCQLKNVTIYSGKNDVGLQRRINVNFDEMTNSGLNIEKNQSRSGYRRRNCILFVKRAEKLQPEILSKLLYYLILIQSNLTISGPGFSHFAKQKPFFYLSDFSIIRDVTP
jgi:hypothetical protein